MKLFIDFTLPQIIQPHKYIGFVHYRLKLSIVIFIDSLFVINTIAIIMMVHTVSYVDTCLLSWSCLIGSIPTRFSPFHRPSKSQGCHIQIHYQDSYNGRRYDE